MSKFSTLNRRPILTAEEYATAESTVGKFSAPGGVGEQALQVGGLKQGAKIVFRDFVKDVYMEIF